MLINQPSKWPMRKILAVVISGAIIGAISNTLDVFWVDHPFAEYYEGWDQWLQLLIMSWAGYMTKERVSDAPNSL